MAGTPDTPSSGKLAETSLPNLLVQLYAARFTGVLRLQRERTKKSIQFQKGCPIASESNLPSEQLGGQLRDADRITQQSYDEVVEYVSSKGCKEGVALLALQLLEPKELFLALKDQVRQRVVACFAWPDGRFEVEAEQSTPRDVQPFRCDPYALVQEGLATHWGAERMLEGLTPHLNRYARPSAAYAGLTRGLKLEEALESLVTSLDGAQTLGQAMGVKGSQPATLAAAWLLAQGGLLRFSDAPLQDSGDEEADAPELDIEIEISGSEAAAGPAAGATSAEAAKAVPKDRKKAKQAKELRKEITLKLENLSQLEHYAVLGVESDAEDSTIKKAYLKAAKRYHPDTLARLALEDMKDQASEVFARIAEAYEVLSDASKRAHYDDSLLDDGPEIDAAVIAQAETFYRKGEILLGMGDFRGALEYLCNAVEIWPEEMVYQSDLGWAYYKKRPSEPEPAREHLAKALELDSNDAVATFRMGLVLRALGDTAGADAHLARARSLDPQVG